MSGKAPRESRGSERRPFATGLVYKKGKFSAIEEQQIAGAIEKYKEVSSRPFRRGRRLSSNHLL